MLFISQPAYIDPSVMTYAVQAIAGVVIAVGAVVVVFWRRAKKKVADKLGLEEKSKKEVEDDIQIIEESNDSTDK
ncbi:MAG: hypothetical protein ACLSS9_08075 [Acutalibacteraceae bacterium]|jgi:hypothetical protein